MPALEIPAEAPAKVKAALQGPEPVALVDLRDREDIQALGAIAGATNIPLENLMAKYEQIPKGSKVILVDLHGAQFPIAGRYLVKQGYAKVVGLAGGVKAWVDAGLPVTK